MKFGQSATNTTKFDIWQDTYSLLNSYKFSNIRKLTVEFEDWYLMSLPFISVVLEVKTTPIDFNIFLICGPGEGATFVH
jgi:hypothetical protein